MGSPAIGQAAHCPDHGAASGASTQRPLAASLCREGRVAFSPPEPDQAPRRLPEPGVLQEAEDAPLHRADAAGDLLRGGPATARWPSEGMPPRTGGVAS